MSSETSSNEFPYPYPYYNEKNERVVCQICGKDFLVISPTHLKKHNLKLQEYKLRFPDAPISSEEFKIRGLHGKDSDLFKPKDTPVVDEPIGEEIVISAKEIEEIEQDGSLEIPDVKEEIKEPPLDPIAKMKKRVFNHLCMYFSNIIADYKVVEKTLGGTVKYAFITDFADPVLRIVIDCPNTFWHNQDAYDDPLRKQKMQEDGWKILEIKSKAPQLKDIEDLVKKL